MGGGGKGEVEKSDAGLFGWKEIKMPAHPYFYKKDITPSQKTDGSYDPYDYFHEKFFDIWNPSKVFNPVKYPNLSPYWTTYANQVVVDPMIKTFMTDMAGLTTNLANSSCNKFELRAVECLEYYGYKQGLTACKDWYDDLMECKHKTKRNLRVKHMMYKRKVVHGMEYLQGKRDYVFEPPPKFHAYWEPHDEPYQFNHE